MLHVEGIIFDMDGVLIDTERIGLQAWLDGAAKVGLEFTESIYKRLIGMRMRDIRGILQEYYSDESAIDSFLQKANHYYQDRINNYPLPEKPGLYALFDYLDTIKMPRAVATSTSTTMAAQHMERLQLTDRLDCLIGGDQVERSKPAPDIFLRAAEKLDLAPESCLVIEDSEKGIEAAWKSGCIPILIPDMIQPNERMKKHASLIFSSLDEFLNALQDEMPPSGF